MRWKNDALILVGALVGGLLGHLAFVWLIGQGLYALVLPGGLLGLGAGLTKRGSLFSAVVCGLIALLIGLYSEWRVFPFKVDESFSYFLAHAYQLKPMTLLMIAVGAAIGFWGPFRESQRSLGKAQT